MSAGARDGSLWIIPSEAIPSPNHLLSQFVPRYWNWRRPPSPWRQRMTGSYGLSMSARLTRRGYLARLSSMSPTSMVPIRAFSQEASDTFVSMIESCRLCQLDSTRSPVDKHAAGLERERPGRSRTAWSWLTFCAQAMVASVNLALDLDLRSCEGIGKDLGLYCQQCGAKFGDETRFCGNCGVERPATSDAPRVTIRQTSSEVVQPAHSVSDSPPPHTAAAPFDNAQDASQAKPFDWNKVLAVIVLIVAAAIWIPIITGGVSRWVGGPHLLITFFAVRWAIEQL